MALDLARVDTRPDREALGCRAIPDRARALNGPRRPVEEGQEAVARCRHLQPPEAVEFTPHAIAMAGLIHAASPSRTAYVRRADDVRDEKRGDDALSASGGFAQPRTPANSMHT